MTVVSMIALALVVIALVEKLDVQLVRFPGEEAPKFLLPAVSWLVGFYADSATATIDAVRQLPELYGEMIAGTFPAARQALRLHRRTL